MNLRTSAMHVCVCCAVGGVVATLSPVKWLATSLWASAVLVLIGSLAVYEDALPGGFDNPTGTDTPAFTKDRKAFKYWAVSLAFVAAAAALGFVVQFQ